MKLGRIAIVHDYLTQTGGAERLALSLSDIFPDAPIFTSIYEPKTTLAEFKNRDVRTTKLQGRIPPSKFRVAAPLYGPAFASLDLSKFDTVIVSTSGFAHHIHHDNAFVYCHTPPHFLYELDAYVSSKFKRILAKAATPLLRIADKRAAASHANYAANSFETAQKIQRAYNRQVPVIHPPLSTSHLQHGLTPLPQRPRLLMIGRLMPYKRFDTAIRAAHIADVPLTIVGAGPEESNLRALVESLGSHTTFAGRVTDSQLAEYWTRHSVALMPGVEDFGFAPLDANYSGRPIIGRNAGGALETIQPEITGLRVDGDDPLAWATAISAALSRDWDPQLLRKETEPFQFPAFRENILNWLS